MTLGQSISAAFSSTWLSAAPDWPVSAPQMERLQRLDDVAAEFGVDLNAEN